MYGIYANIWGILMVNVTIYTIHGSYECKNGVFNFKRSHPKPPNPSTGFSSVNQLVAAGRAAVKTPEGEEMRAVFLVNTEQCRNLSNNIRDFINKHIFCGSTTIFMGLLLESLILVGLTTVFALAANGESLDCEKLFKGLGVPTGFGYMHKTFEEDASMARAYQLFVSLTS